MTRARLTWLPGVLLLAVLTFPAGVSANGVPQLVKLTYIPGISNFGPVDAEGVLEFSFAERYARAEVKNLVPQPGYAYEGWMVNPAGHALFVGDLTLDPAGIGSMEGSFQGIERYDYNLFVVAARPVASARGELPATVSIAGSFTIIQDATGLPPGDSRPLELPETGEAPAGDGIGRWQAAMYAMAATGLLIIAVNTVRKRRGRS